MVGICQSLKISSVILISEIIKFERVQIGKPKTIEAPQDQGVLEQSLPVPEECCAWVIEWRGVALVLGQARPSRTCVLCPQAALLFMSVDQTSIIFYVCYAVRKVEKHWYRALALGGVGVRSHTRDDPTVGKNSGKTTFSGKTASRKK